MIAREKRVDKRYLVRLCATLRCGREVVELQSEDVGFRGLFLRTDTPPELRQLVKIELTLPDTGAKLSMHGMAVHVVARDNPLGRTPGVGVQFYAVDKATQSLWSSFVYRAQKTHPEAEDHTVSLAPVETPDPVRREFPRLPVELELELRSMDELRTLYTRDVSQGGMFIVTDLALPLGAAVVIDVVHPRTGGVFAIDGVVRRVATTPATPGIGVEFVRMDAQKRKVFWDFIRASLSLEPPQLIESGDPLLA